MGLEHVLLITRTFVVGAGVFQRTTLRQGLVVLVGNHLESRELAWPVFTAHSKAGGRSGNPQQVRVLPLFLRGFRGKKVEIVVGFCGNSVSYGCASVVTGHLGETPLVLLV